MQQLFKCLSDRKYTYRTRLLSDNQTISDIFFSHLESIKLYNIFNVVVVMDSTYKTNEYRLPLLEFVGSTSTGRRSLLVFHFDVGKGKNFVWALERRR
ncbi:hypothetical protein QL285_020585 [Trifolium repens]|nr:hypothetical protein QL285_020585 [Trifolium repens]